MQKISKNIKELDTTIPFFICQNNTIQNNNSIFWEFVIIYLEKLIKIWKNVNHYK